MKIAMDILGWSGSAMIVAGYLLISMHKVNGSSILYQFLNIVGSALLIVHTVYYKTVPAAALNVVWLSVGVIAMVRIWLKKVPKPS